MSRADLSDYVTVAERLQRFMEKYPEGSLSFEVMDWRDLPSHGLVVIGRAMAHRTPDDPSPGVGWAMEFVPGKTNFTKGSEIQNLETSAWGRAIAALGIEVQRGIASRDEVRAAQARGGDYDQPPQAATQSDAPPATESDQVGDRLMNLIAGARTRGELQGLVDTINAQPDPTPYQAAVREKWNKVR